MRSSTVATMAALVAIGAIAGNIVLPAWSQDAGTERLRAAIERIQRGGPGAPAPTDGPELGQSELEDLVAPVALYPDALLAQVLVAAAYPSQIADADQLIRASADMTDAELDSALAEKQWDPSVLVLMSGFPTVVSRMAADLDWTGRLGKAMIDQDSDLLAAVQRLRTEAYASGALQSNKAQTVERKDDEIYIRPTDPKVVYVPQYEPAAAFSAAPAGGAPSYQQPVYTAPAPQPSGDGTLQTALISGAIGFGAALLVDQLFSDDDNHHDKDQNWNGYWGRPAPIDWRGRQVYPRPDGHWERGGDGSWAWQRDRHWDRKAGRWSWDEPSRRHYDDERRDALQWVTLPRDPRASDQDWRRAVRRASLEQDQDKARVKAERQRARQWEKARAAQREQDRAEARREAERLRQSERRSKAERQELEARAKADRQEERAHQARQEQRAKRAEERVRQDRKDAEQQARQDRKHDADRARQRRKETEQQAKADRKQADRQARQDSKQEQKAEEHARERQKAEEKAAKQARQDEKRAAERAGKGRAAEEERARQASHRKPDQDGKPKQKPRSDCTGKHKADCRPGD